MSDKRTKLYKEEQEINHRLRQIAVEIAEEETNNRIVDNLEIIGRCYGSHTFENNFKSQYADALKYTGVDKEGKLLGTRIFIKRSEQDSITFSVYKNTTIEDRSYLKEITEEQFDNLYSYIESITEKGLIKGIKELVNEKKR